MKLPQLSLRDLFWLVLVCAVGLGWWVEHAGQEGRHRRMASDYMIEAMKVYKLTQELQSLGYDVTDTPESIHVIKPDPMP